jgi:hypothetical protein
MKLACIVVFLAGGCANRSGLELTAKPPHAMNPKRPSEVVVVMAPARAPGVEVGRLEAESGPHYGWESKSSQTLEILRQKAAQNGCDAIQVDPAGTIPFMSSSPPKRRTIQHARCFVTP